MSVKGNIWIARVAGGFLLATIVSGCDGGNNSPPPPPNLSISTASLADGTVTFPYSQRMQATGGVGPFTWSVSSGNLPHNLILENNSTSSATISGTPDTAQTISFAIEVKDSAGQTTARLYSLNINNARLAQLQPASGQVPAGMLLAFPP